jgi:hypothetical protein
LNGQNSEHNDDQDSGLTIEQIEQCLEAMERRLEDKINKKIQSMNQRLKAMTSKHSSVSGGQINRTVRVESSNESSEKRWLHVESRLESIAAAVGVSVQANVGDDDADRKRLKERLKEALEVEKKKRPLHLGEKESWMEYIFGICKPDGRVGKRGSRSGHA